MNKKDFYSTTEVAKLIGVSRITVFRRIKSGRIKAEKIGRTYAIPREELGVILGKTLTEEQKRIITAGVKKAIKDYGRTLEMLGKA